MKWPREVGTIILVTVVTVLIWLLAAAKTRQTDTLSGRLTMTVASDSTGDRFQVVPAEVPVTLTIEGPAIAVRETRSLLTASPLEFPLPAEPGRHEISRLAERIQEINSIRDIGATIVTVDPPSVAVDIEEFVTRTAVTRADIGDASTVQEVSVSPKEATVTVPRTVLHELPEALVVDAVVDARDIARLEPGVLHTVEGALRLQGDGDLAQLVTISPPTAAISFKLLARQQQAVVERVRIQVVSSPQDFGAYQVKLLNPILSGVSIEAAPEDIRAVSDGRAQVVALIHLSTNDKERGIESKPVSFFAILHADGEAAPVTGSLDGNVHPDVPLSITRVESP